MLLSDQPLSALSCTPPTTTKQTHLFVSPGLRLLMISLQTEPAAHCYLLLHVCECSYKLLCLRLPSHLLMCCRDYWFGFGLVSECASVLVGLAIMITFRLLNVPLLDGLPSG